MFNNKKRKVRVENGVLENKLNSFNVASFEYALNKTESYETGLTTEQAEFRLERDGINEIQAQKPRSLMSILFGSFWNPFIMILSILTMITWVTDVYVASPDSEDWTSVIVIGLMVLVSGIMNFVQEYKANKSAMDLHQLVDTTATVYRDGVLTEIDMEQVVIGDVIRLSAGDMIPADVRFIHAKDIFVSQSAFSGEAEAVEKFAVSQGDESNILDFSTIGFMGTDVVSGVGFAVVIGIGDDTFFGSIAEELIQSKAKPTSFDKGVNDISWLLIRFMFIMVPLVFLINGITKGDWLQALLFAISIAVGLTPEMLPLIVTTNLSKGTTTMAKHKTIVKQLSAIQNFGAMDVLCTDKTGTLTEDTIILDRYLNVHGQEDEHVLRYAYLNSYYQTGLKNLLDRAIIDYANEVGLAKNENNYEKIDELPFDFERRRMSVIVRRRGEKRLITKGAMEEVLALCTHAYTEEAGIIPIDQAMLDTIGELVKDLNSQGMRVLAVAYRDEDKEQWTVEDEHDMVLDGFIALYDPPKMSAPKAISGLQDAGVAVKVVTGDNLEVARNICRHVGIDSEYVLQGTEIEAMSDDELAAVAARTTIFAKVSPLQKQRVVLSLQGLGHTVGFLGDGINDALALKAADLGITVDTAVDIAKENSEVILLEKDLQVLEEGVLEGRHIFGNIVKYVQMAASSNFGNIFSVLVSSIFLPFLPMLPVQLLVQNLLYDVSQTMIPWDNVDAEYLQKPQKWSAERLKRFMLIIGPISSIFDIAMFALLWFVLGANNLELAPLFQTGWFVFGLISQVVIVHIIRTEKLPLLQSNASWQIWLATVIVIAAALILPYTFIGAALGFVALPLAYYPLLLLALFGYVAVSLIVKRWYIRKWNNWL